MKHLWDRFINEGDVLYNYMITNFENMLNGDKIKHFCINDGIYRRIKDTDEMNNEMSDDIQKELIPWIRKEFQEGRLFNKEIWTPFRNKNTSTTMYYGYRKLFYYDKYIFQLSLEEYCELDECLYCNPNNVITNICSENSQHFCLALYGWKEDGSNMLQPHKQVIIPMDDLISDIHWKYNK